MSKETSTAPNQDQESILGFSTRELAGLSVDELTNNKTAITMVMHYYKLLVSENISMKNEINTLRTYVDGYQRKKTNAFVGATLLAVSNILVGFGVSLLSGSNPSTWPGLATLTPGVILIIAGLYFSWRES